MVVITGGSDGIGAAIVRLLAERGIKVAVLDIQPLQYKGEHDLRTLPELHPAFPTIHLSKTKWLYIHVILTHAPL